VAEQEDRDAELAARREDQVMRAAALVLVLGGCAGLIKTSTSTDGDGGSGGETAATAPTGGSGDIVMPNLLGKSLDEAIAIVRDAGFQHALETKPIACNGTEDIEGKINCQDPEPGKTVKRYQLINVNVYAAQQFPGQVRKHQMEALAGLTPDEAKKKLKSYGHDGEVEVRPHREHWNGCQMGRVCQANPPGGTGIHDLVVLIVNPELNVGGPPPE
jgi:beta-lactam-binding protein with PASTA domain